MKKEYPKLYNIYDFISHNDGEGILELETCERMLPIIKEFYEQDQTNYGYKGMDYNFTEDLISILEEVVSKKGKIFFC